MKSISCCVCIYLLFFITCCFSADVNEEGSEGSGTHSVIGGGIRWRNLSVSIADKRKRIRHLVESSSGFVRNGHVVAIIGPSGAGKSTFLAALAGVTPKGSSKKVSGSVWRESQLSTKQNERYPLSIT